MRGGMEGINGSDEGLTKAKNAMRFRASILASLMLIAVVASQIAQGATVGVWIDLIGWRVTRGLGVLKKTTKLIDEFRY